MTSCAPRVTNVLEFTTPTFTQHSDASTPVDEPAARPENPLEISHHAKSNQIKSNLFVTKKEQNATQRKQGKYVNRTQRQHETALTSALQNKKNTTIGI